MEQIMSSKYQSSLALKEHMLEGHKVTQLEAIMNFGVQSMRRALTEFRREGILVKSQRVSMAKALTRINKVASCIPPKELPVREIIVTEYWFSTL